MSPRARTSAAALAALAALAACHPRARHGADGYGSLTDAKTDRPALSAGGSSSGEVAEIDLRNGLPESAGGSFFESASHRTLFDLLEDTEKLADEDTTRGVFVRFGTGNIGFSQAKELGGVLKGVKSRGKPVVCHADVLSKTTLWAALQGCDRVWLSPAGSVESVGIAAQLIFVHDLLARRLGVGIDILQMGKFKGAAESLTRDSASPELRESLLGAFGAIRSAWLDGLTEARGEALRKLAEDGPYSPEQAKESGLVDEIGYTDDARADARKRASTEETEVRFGPGADRGPRELSALMRLVATGSPTGFDVPHVAVLRATGAIGMDSGGGPFGERAGITERGLVKTIRRLANDENTRAVVLRIDSPGGSALASDLIWHELMALREKKTLITSVADMAASGGYYLASAGQRIIAEPTSIVGSIGVVGGKLSFDKTASKVGVNVETITPNPKPGAAARAAYESPFSSWDDATRARVEEGMKSVYDLFLRRVSEGRGIPVETVAASAEGRIFAGQEAIDRHLVDEFGGLEHAIASARKLADLSETTPVRLVEETPSLFDWLRLDDDGSPPADSRIASGAWAKVASGLSAMDSAASARAAPLPPELSVFAASLAPLLAGEPAAALPVALIAR
jgi:protease-4